MGNWSDGVLEWGFCEEDVSLQRDLTCFTFYPAHLNMRGPSIETEAYLTQFSMEFPLCEENEHGKIQSALSNQRQSLR
jgi:hypothetical protein